MLKRKCKKCHEEKEEEEFYEVIKNKNSLDTICKECRKEYRRIYDKKNRKKLNERHRIYAKKNRDIINKAQRRWSENNRDYHKNYYNEVRKHKKDGKI